MSAPSPSEDRILPAEVAGLYRQHARALERIVAARVRTSRETVEDACAFAWMQLLRRHPGRDTVLGWLARTAIREAYKLDQRQRRTLPLDPRDDAVAAHDVMGVRLELLCAREAVAAAGLSDRQARLIGLQVLGYSYREVAEVMTLTERTVERELVRAKRKLRDVC